MEIIFRNKTNQLHKMYILIRVGGARHQKNINGVTAKGAYQVLSNPPSKQNQGHYMFYILQALWAGQLLYCLENPRALFCAIRLTGPCVRHIATRSAPIG